MQDCRFRCVVKIALLSILPFLPSCGAAQSGERTPIAGAIANLPESAPARGSSTASTPIRRMQLVLARSPAQERALEQLLADQQNPDSPRYRQWLTPIGFGEAFGPPMTRLDALVAWLEAQGFTEIHVSAGRTRVEFSGTAASVRQLTIPTQFASLVAGFAALNNLSRELSAPTTPLLRRDARTATKPNSFTPIPDPADPETTIPSNGTVYYGLSPYDFAALYNVAPLWNAASPITGSGQTIAIAGDTAIDPADFVAFRTIFSLPLGNTATSTGTQYLNIIYNGQQPAVLADPPALARSLPPPGQIRMRGWSGLGKDPCRSGVATVMPRVPSIWRRRRRPSCSRRSPPRSRTRRSRCSASMTRPPSRRCAPAWVSARWWPG